MSAPELAAAPRPPPASLLLRAFPLAITLVAGAAVGALLLRWMLSLPGWTERALLAAVAAAYVGWLAWESRVSVRELTRDGPDFDHHTVELAAAAKVALLLALLLGGGEVRGSWAAAGLIVLGAGAALRTSAVRALGAAYSHRIRPLDAAPCRAGPYRWLRHPAYLGTFVAHAGLVLALPNPWAAAVLGLGWLPVVLVRTALEDRLLRESSVEYRDYASHVRARLIPGVW